MPWPTLSLRLLVIAFPCAIVMMFFGLTKTRALDDKKTDSAPPSFESDILPLLQAKCSKCHNPKALKGELDLSSLAGILKGGESGPAVLAGKPEKSPLFEKVHNGEMPPSKKDALSKDQIHQIEQWIAGGAKSSRTNTPHYKNGDNSNTPGSSDSAKASGPNQHDIIPIMLRRCTVCHGPFRKDAGLDLRTKASMLKGGKSGPAINPGKPEESRLIQKIRSGQMPPNDRLVEASIKQPDPVEIDLIAKWIELGAPEVNISPDIATRSPDPLVTDQDRQFWAFRSPQKQTIPKVQKSSLIRNPVDAFILHSMEEKGVTPSPEADRATLLRRVSFDLTGLPPDPQDMKAFLASKDPLAYEKQVDRLLASPRYGERWGRYWLDLVGYADSEGKREQDLPRPFAWRYRDYVIQSLNQDKPFDRFLMEQIAGDELADYEHATEITEEMEANLVATGFLRMAPDATWANITGYVPDRLEVIADEIDVLGSAVLGLTLKCARCHTHKFDPIPHRDYYRLVDIFKGALDEYDWLKPDVRPGIGPVSQDFQQGRLLNTVSTKNRRTWEDNEKTITRQVEDIQKSREKKADELFSIQKEKHLSTLAEPLRSQMQTLLASPSTTWTPQEKELIQKHLKGLPTDREKFKATDPEYQKFHQESEAKIQGLQSGRKPEPRIQALWDRGNPSPTYIYRRGDPLSPGRLVGPGVPSVLTDGKTPFDVSPPWPGASKTGRRLAFAKWLTVPTHPLTARVAVNRVWKHHMGRGIVKTLGNFGKTGTPPTHPELLDWLAMDFVQHGWSQKHLHRLIVTSATYRQSSTPTESQIKLDPENQLFSRMPLVRLDAEALYDTMLLVADRLDETRYGPPDPVQTRPDGLITPRGSPNGWRRLVYVRQQRKELATHLENFDFPQMNPNCLERRDSMVAPQALHLLNNGMVYDLANRFAQRVQKEAGPDWEKQVNRVYEISMNRAPTHEEHTLGVEALKQMTAIWKQSSGKPGPNPYDSPELKALSGFCHAILNSAGFLYID